MAHTFDTNARIPAVGTSTADPLAANYTCGAGTTVLVLMLTYEGNTARTGGAPTYNGVAMTQASITAGVTECLAELWYLLDPPTGSAYELSIQNDGGLTMVGAIASGKAPAGYTSVLEEAGQTSGTGSNPYATVVPDFAGEIIFAVVATGDDTFAPTDRKGTALYEEDLDTTGWGAQYYINPSPGVCTMYWTEATSDDYGAVAATFQEEELPICTVTVTVTVTVVVMG